MQGKNTNIIQIKDTLKAFMNKLDNWKRKVIMINVAMLEELSSKLKVDDEAHVLPDLEKIIDFATVGGTRIRIHSIFSWQ